MVGLPHISPLSAWWLQYPGLISHHLLASAFENDRLLPLSKNCKKNGSSLGSYTPSNLNQLPVSRSSTSTTPLVISWLRAQPSPLGLIQLALRPAPSFFLVGLLHHPLLRPLSC